MTVSMRRSWWLRLPYRFLARPTLCELYGLARASRWCLNLPIAGCGVVGLIEGMLKALDCKRSVGLGTTYRVDLVSKCMCVLRKRRT